MHIFAFFLAVKIRPAGDDGRLLRLLVVLGSGSNNKGDMWRVKVFELLYSEKTINLELKYVDLLQQLKSEMKRCPINTKRSVEQFNLLTHSDQE